jgi:hypothetical protein
VNAGNVASFACGRAHPQLGDAAVCTRQRHHAGDHRAEHDGSLKTWPDAPASWRDSLQPPLPDGSPFPRVHVDTPSYSDLAQGGAVPTFHVPARSSLTVPLSDPIPGELDEDSETWEGDTLELETALGPLFWAWWLLVATLGLLLVLAPALVVLAYRAAFG